MSRKDEGAARVGDDRAVDAGREWAAAVRSLLLGEGRSPAGGWPGTLTEARQRLAGAIGAADGRSHREIDRLARVLYSAAREQWLRDREPSPREEPDGPVWTPG